MQNISKSRFYEIFNDSKISTEKFVKLTHQKVQKFTHEKHHEVFNLTPYSENELQNPSTTMFADFLNAKNYFIAFIGGAHQMQFVSTLQTFFSSQFIVVHAAKLEFKSVWRMKGSRATTWWCYWNTVISLFREFLKLNCTSKEEDKIW